MTLRLKPPVTALYQGHRLDLVMTHKAPGFAVYTEDKALADALQMTRVPDGRYRLPVSRRDLRDIQHHTYTGFYQGNPVSVVDVRPDQICLVTARSHIEGFESTDGSVWTGAVPLSMVTGIREKTSPSDW